MATTASTGGGAIGLSTMIVKPKMVVITTTSYHPQITLHQSNNNRKCLGQVGLEGVDEGPERALSELAQQVAGFAS